jgi:hypothetical protein
MQIFKIIGLIVIAPLWQCLKIEQLNALQLSIADRDPIQIAQNPSPKIDFTKISIGGISLGMSESTVIQKLGQPKQRKFQRNNACTGSDLTTLTYPGMIINLEAQARRNKVYSILVTTPRYQTNTTIGVGNSIDQARKIYPLQFDRITRQWLSSSSADTSLIFSIDRQSKIESIALGTLIC